MKQHHNFPSVIIIVLYTDFAEHIIIYFVSQMVMKMIMVYLHYVIYKGITD